MSEKAGVAVSSFGIRAKCMIFPDNNTVHLHVNIADTFKVLMSLRILSVSIFLLDCHPHLLKYLFPI